MRDAAKEHGSLIKSIYMVAPTVKRYIPEARHPEQSWQKQPPRHCNRNWTFIHQRLAREVGQREQSNGDVLWASSVVMEPNQ